MKRFAACLAIVFGCVSRMPAQNVSGAAFLESARAATEKYQDRAVAILDGYRQIGGDFPAMGEHWINIGLLYDGKIDPEHPEFLTYAVINGEPRLLGLAYALPLLPGESAPDWPAGSEAWHDHFRTIEDETLLPQHHSPGSAGDAPRLAMLHVWTWLANPDGVWAPDNWAIPYARLGLVVPEESDDAAAKALSLVTGGAEYMSMSIEAVAPLSQKEKSRIGTVLAQARRNVELLLHGRSTSSGLTSNESSRLSEMWTDMWAAIDASVGQRKRQQLQHRSIR